MRTRMMKERAFSLSRVRGAGGHPAEVHTVELHQLRIVLVAPGFLAQALGQRAAQ
jgi:hypothetical protein